MYTLTIGDKAYSSWSLRGWLLLAAFDLPFEEDRVPMYTAEFDEMQAARAPARSVPQLAWTEGGARRRIWDTAAIAETLHERHPETGIWPGDPWARAVARTLAAEMHAGFQILRGTAPMNLHRAASPLVAPPEGLDAELTRLGRLWEWARAETGGSWLGGAAFSAADAFYAPVAARLESYALLVPATEDYARQLLAHPAVARWTAEARAEPRRLPRYDDIP
ncbi:MAG: glutathione S-transferase [Paracoccaceae bacterium]